MGAMGGMGGMGVGSNYVGEGLESAYAPLMSPPHSALSNDDYSNGAALPQVAHSDACQSTSQSQAHTQTAQASCASSSYAAQGCEAWAPTPAIPTICCEGLDEMVGMATDGEVDDMTRHAWSPPPPPAGAHGEARGSPFEATTARCKRDRDRDRDRMQFERDRRRKRDVELRQAMAMSATMSLPAAPPLAARSPSRKRLHSEDDDSC
jgi:hypothetical protein